MSCLFCEKHDYILENDYGYAIYDDYPVSLGHMLIIPKKHIVDFFEADEQTAFIYSSYLMKQSNY